MAILEQDLKLKARKDKKASGDTQAGQINVITLRQQIEDLGFRETSNPPSLDPTPFTPSINVPSNWIVNNPKDVTQKPRQASGNPRFIVVDSRIGDKGHIICSYKPNLISSRKATVPPSQKSPKPKEAATIVEQTHKTKQSTADFKKLNIKIWEINSTSVQINFKGSRDDFTVWLEGHKKLRKACVIYGTANPEIAVLKLKKKCLANKIDILKILDHYQLTYILLSGNSESCKSKTQASITKDNNSQFFTFGNIPQHVLFGDKSEQNKSSKAGI